MSAPGPPPAPTSTNSDQYGESPRDYFIIPFDSMWAADPTSLSLKLLGSGTNRPKNSLLINTFFPTIGSSMSPLRLCGFAVSDENILEITM